MQAGEAFVVTTKLTAFDSRVFTKLYLPIIGQAAYSLYQALRTVEAGKLSHLLELLGYGMQQLEQSLDYLTAISLLRVYDQQSQLVFELISPLTPELFLADDFYRSLLITKMGEDYVKALLVAEPSGQELSKSFSDVYRLSGIQDLAQPTPAVTKFDMASFKLVMAKQGLIFRDEASEVVAIHQLAEKFKMNWYELVQLAEKTANQDHTLSIAALQEVLLAHSQPQPDMASFTLQESQVIQQAESHSAQDFLIQLKRQLGGYVTSQEQQLLVKLKKNQIPDSIQSLAFFYYLVKEKRASLSEQLIDNLLNDWQRHKITTARLAMKRIKDYTAQKAEEKTRRSTGVKASPKAGSQVPEWHEDNYQSTASPEEQAAFEAEMRARIDKLQGEQ